VVEHWYTAVWAYNGLAYVNNPNNPTYNSARGAWRPSVGGAAPYQEKILGWLEAPPADGRFAKVPVAYPALADIGTGSKPPALPEPSCGTPTSCATPRDVHASSCFGGTPDAGTPVPDAGLADAGEALDAGTAEPDAGTQDGGFADGGLALETAVGGCGCGALPGGAAWLFGAIVSAWATRRAGRARASTR
jgi:hypothetical protein